MDQGSSAWHSWRDQGVGSSEIAAIMEADGAYQTRFQLFQKRMGLAKQQTEKEQKSKDFIFDKGHRIEEMVRERYERKELISFSADLFERRDKPWQRASVDLCSHEKQLIKEVKYVSLEEFEAGLCPARYFPQIMWQYYVTGYHVDLVLASDYMWVDGVKQKIPTKEGFRTKEVSVPLDMEYIVKMEAEVSKWWHEHIIPKIPPALCDRDAVPLKDKSVQALLKKYAAIEKKLEKFEALANERKELIDLIFKHEAVKHPIMSYGKMKITLTERKGSVDYKKIPELKELSDEYLEKFRGKSTIARSIKC